MELRLSVMVRDATLRIALHRVRPRLSPLLRMFAQAVLSDPIHEAVLVGITDDKGPDLFEVVPTNNEFFQILVGIHGNRTDDELVSSICSALRRATLACPFSEPDRDTIDGVFRESESLTK